MVSSEVSGRLRVRCSSWSCRRSRPERPQQTTALRREAQVRHWRAGDAGDGERCLLTAGDGPNADLAYQAGFFELQLVGSCRDGEPASPDPPPPPSEPPSPPSASCVVGTVDVPVGSLLSSPPHAARTKAMDMAEGLRDRSRRGGHPKTRPEQRRPRFGRADVPAPNTPTRHRSMRAAKKNLTVESGVRFGGHLW